MNNNPNLKGDPGFEISTLTLQERKELIDYSLKAANKNAVKMLLITLPVTFIFVVGIFYFVFSFLHNIR